MVFHEPEYLLSLLEKMLTAFFRISRSMWASFSAFFRSLISCCSGVTTGFPLPVKLESTTAEYSLLQRRTISEGISKSWLISLEDFPFLWSSTTITLKALSKVLLDLSFIDSKLRGLTYCPIKCSRSSSSVLEDKWRTVSREASNKQPFYGSVFPEHINVFKNILKQVDSFRTNK